MKTQFRKLKQSILLFVVMFTPYILLAQTDSTAAQAGGGFFSKIPAWLPAVLAFVYEASVRLIPTKSNWSVLGLVVKIIQGILPNRSTDAINKLP